MIYIELFHGRKPIDKEMDEWGEPGPVFGPYSFAHTTYLCEIKLGTPNDDPDILSVQGDLVYYDGWWYGDWSVFTEDVLTSDGKKLIEPFDRSKAELPKDDAVIV